VRDELFKLLLENHVFPWEGGFVNDPQDRGGATKYGITLATLRAYRGAKATVRDVRNLTKEEAERIYKAAYWTPLKPDKLPVGLLALVFDASIQSGVGRAVKQLQQVLNSTKIVAIAVDGVMGTNTIQAVRAVEARLGEDALQDMYADVRDSFFEHLAASGANFRKFVRGWRRRLRAGVRLAARLSIPNAPDQE
jgi:lysozyme family protein